MSKNVSDEFAAAAGISGCLCAIDCELCNRTHFVEGSQCGSYGDGELEELQRKANADPDKYVRHDDSIDVAHIDGKVCVIDCPCGKLRRYEDWIWAHRRIIASYLVRRAEAELKKKQRDAAEVVGLKDLDLN